jgi:hypothetical protein
LFALILAFYQEVQKSKQQIYLSDLKRSLAEMRMDAQRRVNEYMREIQTAEKDLTSAEKKIQKSKEALDRASNRYLFIYFVCLFVSVNLIVCSDLQA